MENTTDRLVGTWKIILWKPDEKEYEGLFPAGCELTIERGHSELEPLLLTWTAENRSQYSLSFDSAGDRLLSATVEIEGFSCRVALTFDGLLQGKITSSPAQTGPAGTFIAEASDGEEEPDRRRSRPRRPRGESIRAAQRAAKTDRTTIDHFARSWKVQWAPANASDQDYFADQGTLLIGIAENDRAQCCVAWSDVLGQCWCITGLPFTEGRLKKESIWIRGATQSFQHAVTLWIEDGVLHGTLEPVKTQPFVEGPVGTFTAEASIGEQGTGRRRPARPPAGR